MWNNPCISTTSLERNPCAEYRNPKHETKSEISLPKKTISQTTFLGTHTRHDIFSGGIAAGVRRHAGKNMAGNDARHATQDTRILWDAYQPERFEPF